MTVAKNASEIIFHRNGDGATSPSLTRDPPAPPRAPERSEPSRPPTRREPSATVLCRRTSAKPLGPYGPPALALEPLHSPPARIPREYEASSSCSQYPPPGAAGPSPATPSVAPSL